MTEMLNPGFELFGFFERTPDLVCIAGKDGFFKRVNPAVLNKLGYTEEELFSRPISSFIYNDDREVTHTSRKTLLSGEVLHNFINRYVKKNGQIVWLEWTSIYFSEKEIVLAIAKDITERKRLEEEIEEKYKTFKGLTSHFKSNMEKDRTYFAYELHEEVAQLAAAVKMNINWIADNAPGLPESSKTRIENAGQLSELLIKKIQKIAFSISANMLDLFSLNDTLQWLCNEFTILNGIPCIFESDYVEESLTKEMKIDFFRICQEALTNIADHAEANNVDIRIEDSGNEIRLKITDDGNGFDVKQKRQSSSGLDNMRSRASSINGQLTVDSNPGNGTIICLIIQKSKSEQDDSVQQALKATEN